MAILFQRKTEICHRH